MAMKKFRCLFISHSVLHCGMLEIVVWQVNAVSTQSYSFFFVTTKSSISFIIFSDYILLLFKVWECISLFSIYTDEPVLFSSQLPLFTPDHRWHRAQVPFTLLQDRHLHPWDRCPWTLCEERPPLRLRSWTTWPSATGLWYQVGLFPLFVSFAKVHICMIMSLDLCVNEGFFYDIYLDRLT